MTRLHRLVAVAGFALCLPSNTVPAAVPELLWTQYTVGNGSLKLAAHTSADPTKPTNAAVTLQVQEGESWKTLATVPVDPLTAMSKFRIDAWNSDSARVYRVTLGESRIDGTIRAEPGTSGSLKLMAIACVSDDFFPQAAAVKQMIGQDPDLLFFAGDQLYEKNSGGEVVIARSKDEVPAAMLNYLAKWRKFGAIFRDLLKDRPSIVITDDHDVYAADLWGRGGKRDDGRPHDGRLSTTSGVGQRGRKHSDLDTA